MSQQSISNGESGLITRGKINSNFTELYAGGFGYVASGTGTYTVSITGISAYVTGQIFDIQFTSANTVANPTLNINGLGAVRITKDRSINLLTGEIIPGTTYRLYYDGSTFKVRMDSVRTYNVESFGAKHDYQAATDASVTSGSATLTTVADRFTTADTGKSIRVFGAGAAGADLLTTITFVNSKTVTLGVNASTTISAKRIEWGTDDTQPIQNAINNAFTNGGGTVYLPNGIYFLASALDWHGTGVNSQIYIPVTSLSETKQTIKIIGESSLMWPSGPFGAQNLPTTGVILKSVIVGTGTLPTVFGSASTNATTPILDSITVMTKSMTGTAHVAPTMSAFILKECQVKQLTNVMAITESDPTESVEPSAVTYGFWMTEIGATDSHTIFNNTTASNYYYGHRFEEHDWWSRVNSYTCLHGFAIAQSAGGGQGHILGAGSGALQALWCRYGITMLGNRTIEINYETEHWPGILSPSRWFDFVADFYFPSSQNISGRIQANCENAGGTLTVPVVSGTNTGILIIYDIPSGVTYGSGDIINLLGSGASRNGIVVRHTNSAAQATIYMDNNRGVASPFSSYGGFYYGGSTVAGSFLGTTKADKLMIFSDGASNQGFAIGTRTAMPFILATNDVTRMSISGSGSLALERTNTAAATTGNQTINKMAGSVNFAAAATALTVTNSLVSATSNIFVMIQTNDTTAEIKNVVPGAGSFVINMGTAPTAETRVAFWVTN